MFLVPVLDLRHGRAVHAVRGERAAYRPVHSALVADSAPVAVACALLDAAHSRTLYVADLDALLGEPPQAAMLRALLAALPGCALWLDAAFADIDAARTLLHELDPARVTPVFGSESARAVQPLPDGAMLSLDARHGAPLDPAGWWQRPDQWPKHVIAMSLDRVGSGDGPDLAALRTLQQRAPHVRVIGAGGIRDTRDLDACAAAGAHAWLVASALHDGRASRHGTPLATLGADV
jgi:phosphoribosylformimino-5-aminoimidazole carboxamide ribotide isomerase